MILPAIRITSCKAYWCPLEAIIRHWMVHSTLSASHRTILVCLLMPNGSHTHTVGRFITAILLECDDFFTILPAIMTSWKAYCRPLEAIIRHWMVHSLSLPAIAPYWCVYSCQNGSHTHTVGRFITAILLECDDFFRILKSHKDIL